MVRDEQLPSILYTTVKACHRHDICCTSNSEVSSLCPHTVSSILQCNFPCPLDPHLLQTCLYLHLSSVRLHPFAPLNRWQISDLSPDFPPFLLPVLPPPSSASTPTPSGAPMASYYRV